MLVEDGSRPYDGEIWVDPAAFLDLGAVCLNELTEIVDVRLENVHPNGPFRLWPPGLPERVSITATLIDRLLWVSGGCASCARPLRANPRGYPRRLWAPSRRHCPAPLTGGPIANSALLAVFPQCVQCGKRTCAVLLYRTKPRKAVSGGRFVVERFRIPTRVKTSVDDTSCTTARRRRHMQARCQSLRRTLLARAAAIMV
jgi:hypothetical protein